MKLFNLSLCILIGLIQVQAEEFAPSIRWLGDIRVRSEIDMRDFSQKTHPNTITLLRTRVGLEARPLEDVRVLIQARDARAFGEETSTLSDSRNLDLHQGFVEIRNLFVEPLILRLGRQELSYGNERIVGAVGWHNVGRVFDGALLRADVEAMTVDLFAMNVREVQPYVSVATPATVQPVDDQGSDFLGTHLTMKKLSSHTLDGYFFYEWYRGLSTPQSSLPRLSRFTVGTHAKGKLEMFDYEAEVAYQGGKLGTADVSAYLLTGTLGYGFAGSVLSRLAGGYEVLSGNTDGATYKAFDPVYHTGHKFYGFMDYFINIPANTAGKGLTDLFLRTSLQLSEKQVFHCWIHHFTYHQPVDGQRVLGQEIDLVLNFRYNKNVTFDVGASAFVPDALMRQRFGGSDVAFWGYVQALVVF